ncbi:MAG: hypothetical protein JAZ11_13430 [Candidatus Thiodiazotropha lotti]|nr:hypothetical protein [Candidatus Thiodiazotropha lotti]
MATVGRCSVDGCHVGDGGSCIEGFQDLADCPNFVIGESDDIREPADTDEVSDSTGESEQAIIENDEGIPPVILASGNALTSSEAHHLTRERSTCIVMLVGMVKSGKTTVLAELYEQFRRGQFAGHLFAGSKTIVGFEKICHLARAASQGKTEDTSRTIRESDNNLLHLDLIDQNDGSNKRLLATDLSGELFENATLASDNLLAIPYLRRVNHLVLFADAEKLCDLSERQKLLNKLLVLLRCCTEEAVLQRTCRLTVVVSRHDLLPGDMDTEFLSMMEKRIRSRVARYLNEEPRFLSLAARPMNAGKQPYGLAELLSYWLEIAPPPQASLPNFVHAATTAHREIDKLSMKVAINEE